MQCFHSENRIDIRVLLKEYGITLLVTVCAAFFLKTFVVDAYSIPSLSMQPTLLRGDYIIVNKLAYGISIPGTTIKIPVGRAIRRGEVIVFNFPELPNSHGVFIKRCVGLPGDTVVLYKNTVVINGKSFPELHSTPEYFEHSCDGGYRFKVPQRGDTLWYSDLKSELLQSVIEREGHRVIFHNDTTLYVDGHFVQYYIIEDNHYFVLGDNYEHSYDSRHWGFVPEHLIVGEALIIYWSWDTEVPTTTFAERFRIIRWERIGKLIH
ncbi:MAG: signal peptidase I [Bacteroidetes bacterium]|nr:signal peptidase I [Bacteroidota bacterium]